MKKKAVILGAAMTLALFLTACGGETAAPTTGANSWEEGTSASGSETAAPDRTVTGTMLLDGKETAVYLQVTDTEIDFWDSASGGTLLMAARYPEAIAGAADALNSCDYTDLDEDGYSDLTADFAFADGETASLVWFHTDGGLVYNGEFSRLPGEQSPAEAG